MEEKELSEFLAKFSRNQHTEQEHNMFMNWVSGLSRRELEKVMDRYLELDIEHEESTYPGLAQKIEERLSALSVRPQKKVLSMQLWPKWRYIAIAGMLVLCTFAGLYYFNFNSKDSAPENKTVKHSVFHGGNKAVLSLADGSEIILDAAKIGKLAEQGQTAVYKEKDGQLVFDASLSAKGTTGKTIYNVLTTPRGGQYMLKLPDGSKVWLNSASSLKFPSSFSDKERTVELTGEGYFEIVKDKTKPFLVKTATQRVEVLGTHFNINAYPEEYAVATTLLEGSVKLTIEDTGQEQLLKPGQQARLTNVFAVSDVDPLDFVDWKDGYFKFSRENIQSIMRKVARWYDVDVIYEGTPTREGFVGTVPRSKDIREVLNVMKLTGVMNYRIEGKQVFITP